MLVCHLLEVLERDFAADTAIDANGAHGRGLESVSVRERGARKAPYAFKPWKCRRVDRQQEEHIDVFRDGSRCYRMVAGRVKNIPG